MEPRSPNLLKPHLFPSKFETNRNIFLRILLIINYFLTCSVNLSAKKANSLIKATRILHSNNKIIPTYPRLYSPSFSITTNLHLYSKHHPYPQKLNCLAPISVKPEPNFISYPKYLSKTCPFLSKISTLGPNSTSSESLFNLYITFILCSLLTKKNHFRHYVSENYLKTFLNIQQTINSI